jgi:hypothetical protein
LLTGNSGIGVNFCPQAPATRNIFVRLTSFGIAFSQKRRRIIGHWRGKAAAEAIGVLPGMIEI